MPDLALRREFLVADLPQTKLLAIDLVNRLKGGEVIVLEGDLGSGKTAFVKGFVEAAGGPEASSPSFTIENIYQTRLGLVHHYDFYRLNQLGVDGLTLTEVIGRGEGLVFIEWAELVHHLLGDDYLQLGLALESQPTARRLTYQAPVTYDYLLPPADLLTKPDNGFIN